MKKRGRNEHNILKMEAFLDQIESVFNVPSE